MIVVDTNIYFSALHNPEGNEAEIVRKANAGDVILFSPDTVREELRRVLLSKIGLGEKSADSVVDSLPVVWVPRSEYCAELDHARSLLTHKEDSPILACALRFKTAILTGNRRHFDVPAIRGETPVLSSRRFLRYLESRKE